MEQKRTTAMPLKLAAILCGLVVVTALALGGTLAKYTDAASASGSARIAAFSTQSFKSDTIDLYDTLYEEDIETAENNVVPINADKVIAPGTGGKYAVDLTNDSEVDVEYLVEFEAMFENGIAAFPVAFNYSYDDGATWAWSDWKSMGEVKEIAGEMDASEGSKTLTIAWKWPFTVDEAQDAADTLNGESVFETPGTVSETAPAVTVANTVTFTQID